MADLQNPTWWSRFWGLFGSRHHLQNGQSQPAFTGTGEDGETVTSEKSLRVSAVWGCVHLRSDTISSMPLHLLDESHKPATTHPLYRILHDRPNADMVASEFWGAMVASLDLWGNAYAEIKRNKAGVVTALQPLDSSKMSIKRGEKGELLYILAGDKTFTEDKILHFKGFSLDGVVGLSPIQYAAQMLGAQQSADKTAKQTMKNAVKAGGFFEVGDRILTQEQRDGLRGQLDVFSQPENAGKYMILEGGMKVTPFNFPKMSAADAQILESRKFGIEEICRIFKTPPPLIGHTEKSSSWASSFDSMLAMYLSTSINPILVRFEQNLLNKLLPISERKKYRVKFSVEGLLRTDTAARSEFTSTMLQNGVMTRNEIRALENLPPVEGGDELTVQVNMTNLRDLGKDKQAA